MMPGHPDPRLNLAIALERGGEIEDAILAYEAVLEIRPELDAAMVGLISLQLRHKLEHPHPKSSADTAHVRVARCARVG